MLNLKKGLAIVLAAATAFTFAPVANLGSAVTANAAATEFDKIGDITLKVKESADYEVNIPNLKSDAKFKVETSNPDVAKVMVLYAENTVVTKATTYTAQAEYSDGNGGVENVPNGAQIRVVADPANTGKSEISIKYTPQGGTEQTKQFTVTVNALSDAPNVGTVIYTDYNNSNLSSTINNHGIGSPNAVFVMKTDDQSSETTWAKIPIADADNGNHYALTSAEVLSGGSNYIQVTGTSITKGETYTTTSSTGSVKVAFLAPGTATLRLTGTNLSTNKDKSVDIVINVISTDSTMKINGNEITTSSDKSDVIKQTITLTGDNATGKIVSSLDNPRSGEALKYKVFRVESDGTPFKADLKPSASESRAADTFNNIQNKYNESSDINVSADGTVTATANALNAVEQYYDVLVTNNKATDTTNGKAAWVRVITIRNSKTFTKLDVTVDEAAHTGTKYSAAASYGENGNVADAEVTKDLKLSTKDFTSTPYTALANGSTTVNPTSTDTSVIAIENGKLVAKKAGYSVVTFAAKSDKDHYGNATIKLQVTVVDRYIANKISAENINLTLQNKTATIAPTSDPKTTYHFSIGHKDASGNWVEEGDSHLTLNKSTGEVTFDGLGIGSAQVQITGDAVNGVADAPKAAVITVSYSNLKQSDLNVTTKSLALSEGETGAIVASGTALSYVSSDEDVATVDSTGNVTGVNAGTAVITVQSKGNDYVAAATDTVIVTVKAATQKPAKVTGLKVSNKKGAYVSVKWTSQGKNINYRIWKKVGNGKWVGKNVAGNKATLSVKKGAKVQVKVKAYVKDSNGKTTWGPTATKAKTFKTDKK